MDTETLLRKYYDTIIGDGGGYDHVIKTESKEDSLVIECDCGTHLLKVQSDIEIYYTEKNPPRYRQDIYFAMFGYGNQKRSFWGRLVIAFKYLRTGKMFSDQLIFNPEEATKLSDFLNRNLNTKNNHRGHE